MARPNDIAIDFISCTQLVEGVPVRIDLLDVCVETIIPANLNFFGAGVEPCEDGILKSQINFL